MTIRHAAAVTGSALLVFGLAALGVTIALRGHVYQDETIIGTVLRADQDPAKQLPVPGAYVAAISATSRAETHSDSTGFFSLTLNRGLSAGRPVILDVNHPDYKSLSASVAPGNQIEILRLDPLKTESPVTNGHADIVISDIRIRYTVTVASAVNSGTVAKTFQAENAGGLPCEKGQLCSPDGRWKAAANALTLHAPEDGKFENVRVSCIAGPCPFTQIDPPDRTDKGQTLHVSARAWSDTATFLVEADVVHTVLSEMVRQSFPVIFGRGMSFTLPGSATGPSIEAEVNSSYTVFPLGPALRLSWATCGISQNQDTSKLYSCETRSGYRLQ